MFKGGRKVSEQLTKYLSDATTGNLLLAKEVHNLKGAASINVSTTTNRKVTFNKYDVGSGGLGNGNILEYSLENGTPVCFIWGYDKSKPIAKLENISYANIPAATITDLQAKSNTDDDHCTTSTCKEQILRTALNDLRAAFPNAMVTTYTYDPNVGLTSVTDPKGDTQYYTYDAMGRLQAVKDSNQNILSENQYHYKSQF